MSGVHSPRERVGTHIAGSPKAIWSMMLLLESWPAETAVSAGA
jgi:hypothetical protein